MNTLGFGKQASVETKGKGPDPEAVFCSWPGIFPLGQSN